ncbi:unnamed protein product [Soboliphyme baturini]|uniref:Transposase n=1 Tax=Soboliphyme baturini TaxID=241478 RepID=A0A183IT71_9BILA|nr:unnamed protein product [Soboliphyme baturini]
MNRRIVADKGMIWQDSKLLRHQLKEGIVGAASNTFSISKKMKHPYHQKLSLFAKDETVRSSSSYRILKRRRSKDIGTS